MSVPVYKRSENKLQALTDTIEMAKYTIQMCENNNIFPKKTRWTICTRLIDTCIDCIIKIRQANKIKADTIEKAKERISLQSDVLLNFDALYAMMDLAMIMYSIPTLKLCRWTELMLSAENTTTGWRKSDMDKLKKLEK